MGVLTPVYIPFPLAWSGRGSVRNRVPTCVYRVYPYVLRTTRVVNSWFIYQTVLDFQYVAFYLHIHLNLGSGGLSNMVAEVPGRFES